MNSIPEHEQVLIDKYLRDTLTDAEQAEFEHLCENPAFKARLQEMKDLHKAMVAEGREGLRREFRTWDARKSKGRIIDMRKIAAAAAVILALVAVYYLVPGEERPETLASAYIEPYPNVVAPLQKSGDAPSTFEKAFQLYESGKYKKAEEVFASLDQANESVQFYRAVNKLLLGDSAASAKSLLAIVSDNQHGYFNPALWYLALAQVENGQNDQARITLRNVIGSNSPFTDKALALMNSL